MVQTQFSLSWDSHKSSICTGFSYLQQNGEFVDMTLAADGHHVKVHQVLMALASPYIKDLITSAPCQHPVIFLNNVSHKTLCLLLEYIYIGEVVIPSDYLSSFMETAKSLHIKGLENAVSGNMPILESGATCVSGIKRVTGPSIQGHEEVSLPASAKKIVIKNIKTINEKESVVSSKQSGDVSMNSNIEYQDMPLMDDPTADSDDCFNMQTTIQSDNMNTPLVDKTANQLQFTVSIRGSLQVILNRYIYNVHSSKYRTGLRRWRCVDYRNKKCKAFLVTKGNVVINRSNLHNHPFHDKKILSKIQSKAVFSALDEIEGYKDQEFAGSDNDAIDNDTFMTEFDKDSEVKS